MGPVIFDELTVDGFDCNDLQIVNACAFRHVVFRGVIRRVNVSWQPITSAPKFAANIERLNREFHSNVDWALDLSEAEFDDTVVRLDVPYSLIRLDPGRQVIVPQRAVLSEAWTRVQSKIDPVTAASLNAMAKWGRTCDFEIVGTSRGDAESVRVLRGNGLCETS